MPGQAFQFGTGPGAGFDLDYVFHISAPLGNPEGWGPGNETSSNNATVRLADIQLEDSHGNPISSFVLTSDSGALYGPNGAFGESVPEPNALVPMLAGLCALALLLKRSQRQKRGA